MGAGEVKLPRLIPDELEPKTSRTVICGKELLIRPRLIYLKAVAAALSGTTPKPYCRVRTYTGAFE
jgi:hypothetical protein